MRDENWVNDSDARNSEYGGHPKNIPSLFIPDPEPTRFTLQCQRRGHVFVLLPKPARWKRFFGRIHICAKNRLRIFRI